MDESADEPRAGSRPSDTAVVCDANAFNVRFLRAAMHKLGFAEVVDTRTVDDLIHQATVHQATVVVFDPAMRGGAGVDVIGPLRKAVPDALLVAFCSDDDLIGVVKAMGVVTVHKVGIMQLDALIATIQERLGRPVTGAEEGIPVADMATPVWDLVPSLANPEPEPTDPPV